MTTITTRWHSYNVDMVTKIPSGYEIWTHQDNVILLHNTKNYIDFKVDTTTLKAIVVDNEETADALNKLSFYNLKSTKQMTTYLKKYANSKKITYRHRLKLDLIDKYYDSLKSLEA